MKKKSDKIDNIKYLYCKNVFIWDNIEEYKTDRKQVIEKLYQLSNDGKSLLTQVLETIQDPVLKKIYRENLEESKTEKIKYENKIIEEKIKSALFPPLKFSFSDFTKIVQILSVLLIISGFLRAFITARMLGLEMSLIFGISDYWNYGVSSLQNLFLPVGFVVTFTFLTNTFTDRIDYRYIPNAKKVTSSNHVLFSVIFLITTAAGILLMLRNDPLFLLLFFIATYFILLLLYSASLYKHISLSKKQYLIILFAIIFIGNVVSDTYIHLHEQIYGDYHNVTIHHTLSEEGDIYIASTSKYHISKRSEDYFLIPAGTESDIEIE
jgi:hypothetical protein